MNKEFISILGCGWLGLPLAKALIDQGYKVKGSTTRESKIAELNKEGIEAYKMELLPEINCPNTEKFLQASTLILNLPPRVGKHGENFHWLQIQNLLPALIASPLEKILFISSTSVYGSMQGEVDEQTVPVPDKSSGKVLLRVENYLKEQSRFKVTVLRLAGLIGPDRHPVKNLAGKQNLPRGNAPINLIHQQDCIGIIQKILQKQAWNEVFNAAADEHTPRSVFYSHMARIFDLEPPTFVEEKQEKNYKIIGHQKVKQMLEYNFECSVRIIDIT